MSQEFAQHCAELFAPLGPVRLRRMFGGHGLYVDDLFVALIADEQLFLKIDAQTRPRFEAAGCRPFTYQREGETMSLGYFCPPEEALESSPLLMPWARLAMEAALRAQADKLAKAAAAVKRRKAPAKPKAVSKPKTPT
ncbi:TfoX/Sxy family protein [Roseateles koreensis]|uniref:TfoX/Sxy family protein n=1 Tax=Roseateles koreensis TaxID=2987526 RepID=A0ABT5KNX1_9BURK|nr:TfoX/Sxy family protein [Roseateles koreensis]MDC8784620.1 TfoX/Sxy family protein [Roseateles koreensis]